MDYTGIRIVEEIRLRAEDDYSPVQLVNAYLELGWIILAIHQRAFQSENVIFETVYVLGNFDANPQHPETE